MARSEAPAPAVVLDTNVLVSALLLPRGVCGQALRRALLVHRVVVSVTCVAELERVLKLPKLRRYVSNVEIEEFLLLLGRAATIANVVPTVHVCRDPLDDAFLDLALVAGAGAIVSGDRDLLALNPFRGIAIATPRAFLERR